MKHIYQLHTYKQNLNMILFIQAQLRIKIDKKEKLTCISLR